MKKLKDVMSQGIFSKIRSPTLTIFDADNLDILFISQYGNRIISNIVCNLLDGDTLTDNNLQRLADIINMRYHKQWTHLLSVYNAEYNPIDNYNMTELEGTTHENNNTISHNNTINSVIDDSENKTVNASGNANTNNNVFAFNTTNEDGVPSAKSNGNNSTNETVVNKHDIKNDITEDRNTTNINNGSDSRVLTRSGNIGATSQQMLQSELDLWKWDFLETVFKNVADMLTLRIY